jgi:hypothetical protein
MLEDLLAMEEEHANDPIARQLLARVSARLGGCNDNRNHLTPVD